MLNQSWKLSAKVLIFDNNGQCLLLKRSLKSKGNAGKWEPVGGKIDPGESFDRALLREVEEEAGLKVSLHHVAGISESELPNIKVVHLLLEGKLESGQVRLSEEHTDYAWVNPVDFSSFDLADWFLNFSQKYTNMKPQILTRK